jgi:hypothetical protein
MKQEKLFAQLLTELQDTALFVRNFQSVRVNSLSRAKSLVEATI